MGDEVDGSTNSDAFNLHELICLDNPLCINEAAYQTGGGAMRTYPTVNLTIHYGVEYCRRL